MTVKAAPAPKERSDRLIPSELLKLMKDPLLVPDDTVSADTETSGLYADDGARVATASVAWVDWSGAWAAYAGRVSYAVEEIAPGYSVPIVSTAWPFDQGVEAWSDHQPKAEYKGQASLDLWPSAQNLSSFEWRSLLDWLAARRLSMHPMKFDCEKFRVGVRVWPGVGMDLEPMTEWDTQNVCDLIWPLEKKGLKATHDRIWPNSDYGDASKLVKAYLSKAKLPAGRWDLVPWEVIGPYADMDARMTKKVELRQKWEIAQGTAASWLHDEGAYPGDQDPRDAVFRAIARRMATSRYLYRMERRGLPYDRLASRAAGEQAQKVALGLAGRLPFEPKDAKRFFFEPGFVAKKTGVSGLGLVPYQMTNPSTKFPAGQPSMTDEVLRRMVEDGVDHAEAYATWAKIDNSVNMWYFGYADKVGPDERLRCAFRQNGTRSTRFSVERFNIQAIPHDYRMSGYSELEGIPSPRQIIGACVRDHYPGWRLWELDLQQAELRIGALMAKCGSMLELMETGADMHSITARALFKADESHAKWGQYRQIGKRGNFSLGFGAGGKTFRNMISKETNIRLGEAESFRIVRDWNALYPEWGAAIQRHQKAVDRRMNKFGHAWVAFANGERRWFQPYEESHKAFNQRVQGTQAQFCIDWGLAAEAYLLGQNLDCPFGEAGLIVPIHDSLNVLLPDNERGVRMKDHIAQIARDLWAEWFPGITGGVDTKSW